LARLAKNAGVSGVVASAQDIELLRLEILMINFIIVTPGIRSVGSTAKDDQKRTLSAYEAIKRGADYIVEKSLGTTPRQLTDLLGSLCDLTTGSGDKGTPVVHIQGYFDDYVVE